jgi:hypothetical protein
MTYYDEDTEPEVKSIGTTMTCLDCGSVLGKEEHQCPSASGVQKLRAVVHSGAGIGIKRKMSGHVHEYKPACPGKPCTCEGILPVAPPTRVLPPPPLSEWPTFKDLANALSIPIENLPDPMCGWRDDKKPA